MHKVKRVMGLRVFFSVEPGPFFQRARLFKYTTKCVYVMRARCSVRGCGGQRSRGIPTIPMRDGALIRLAN